MTNNIKPLGEWTLAEVKQYCNWWSCVDCLFYKPAANPDSVCQFRHSNPAGWDLSEPPRWTEQDIEDAKAIMKVFAWAENTIRYGDKLQVRKLREDRIVDVSNLLLPSLLPGHLVKLKEIAEYKREG